MELFSDRQVRLVRGSFERMLARRVDLAGTFYGVLFDRHPEVRGIFPPDMAGQMGKLEKTLAFVVEALDRPGDLRGPVRDLARRHVGYGVTAEAYLLVEPVLLDALRSLEGADLTRPELDAWSDMICEIGAVMMQETLLKSA